MISQLSPAKVTLRLCVFSSIGKKVYKARIFRFTLPTKGATVPVSICKN